MQIGRKIFYLLANGHPLLDVPPFTVDYGDYTELTTEQEFSIYTALQGIDPSSVGTMQLPYGQDEANFAKYPFHIDVTQNPPAIVWDVNNTYGASLDEVKAAKNAQLEDLYNQQVSAGFSSSALGVAHTYPSDQAAQLNIQIVIQRLQIAVKKAQAAGVDLTNPANVPTYEYLTLDAGPLAHNLDQMEQVFADGVDGATPAITKLRNLRAQVAAATTIDDVNKINW